MRHFKTLLLSLMLGIVVVLLLHPLGWAIEHIGTYSGFEMIKDQNHDGKYTIYDILHFIWNLICIPGNYLFGVLESKTEFTTFFELESSLKRSWVSLLVSLLFYLLAIAICKSIKEIILINFKKWKSQN